MVPRLPLFGGYLFGRFAILEMVRMQRYRKLPKPSLGDYILQVIFNLQSDFPGTEFFGAETFLKEATINHGISKEVVMELDVDAYKKIVDSIVRYAAKLKRVSIEKILDSIWQWLGQKGMMPTELKKEFFESYYDEKVKIGDRHEKKRFAVVLTQILAKYYKSKG